MYNHAPEKYICPICLGVKGIESEATMLKRTDVVYKDELVTVFVNSKCIQNNPGHAIVVPNEHFENVYDMSEEVLERVIIISQKMARALKKSHECDGVMILQNNEPASDQHAFHYHMHIIPRFFGDDIFKYMGSTRISSLEERIEYAEALKENL